MYDKSNKTLEDIITEFELEDVGSCMEGTWDVRFKHFTHERKTKGKQLRMTLERITDLECKQLGEYYIDIRDIKQKLALHDEERYRGEIVRARA